jgi:hypothetical protein
MGEGKKKSTKKSKPAKTLGASAAKRPAKAKAPAAKQAKPKATPAKEKAKKVEIEVELPLSDKEKVKRGQLACQLLNEKAEIEIEKKKANDHFKEEMAALGSRAHKLLREFETGREKRTVSATEVRNFARNVVEYSYQGKVVKTRPMAEADRQDELPLKEKTGAKQAKASTKTTPATSSDYMGTEGPAPESSQAPTPPSGEPSLQTTLPLTAPMGELAGKVCANPEGKPVEPKVDTSLTSPEPEDDDISNVRRLETGRNTKTSAVDGARA